VADEEDIRCVVTLNFVLVVMITFLTFHVDCCLIPPSSFSCCLFAVSLDLSSNRLDGTIPTELGSLSKLGELWQTRRTFVAWLH